MRSIASFFTLALAAAPAAALACTPAPGYRVPTNLELAGQADTIVLGQVVPVEGEGPDDEPRVTVHPLAAYKGLTPGQDFPLPMMALATGPLAEYAQPSDPLELEKPHPAAYSGSCIRSVFAPGATVLFFLKRHEGNWTPAGGPFSRWAEDVTGEDAPWVQLARFYAAVAELPEDDRKAVLEAERDALLAHADDASAQAMGGDIDRQLAGPNPPLVEPLPDPAEDFRDPAGPSAVQRALDAMRADQNR
ncbi:MAG TPA: hypothetical protein VNR60_01765 [Croceibacterium sp.]|nr:hypothetical protein [Croceibacterium sp.]